MYNEILVKEQVFFPSFKNDFEASVGKLILKSTLKEQPSLLQDLASLVIMVPIIPKSDKKNTEILLQNFYFIFIFDNIFDMY